MPHPILSHPISITFPMSKCSQIGERVKVVNGAHAGESGMLMHVLEGDRCLILSDISREQIQVFSRWVGAGCVCRVWGMGYGVWGMG